MLGAIKSTRHPDNSATVSEKLGHASGCDPRGIKLTLQALSLQRHRADFVDAVDSAHVHGSYTTACGQLFLFANHKI